MLLAVIDLVERGDLTEKIRYEYTLDGFKIFTNAVRPGKDMKPYLPFYHFNGEVFWSLRPKKGNQRQGSSAISQTDDGKVRVAR